MSTINKPQVTDSYIRSNVKSQLLTIAQSGFTLIELLLAISIVGVLFGLTTFSLLHAQQKTSITTSEEMLIADLKGQQTKAMNGIENGGSFGVRFSLNNTYTLFHGAINSPVTVDDNISFTSNGSGNNIIFSPVSGEITPTTITVKNAASSEQKNIVLNKYGVVTQD